MKKAALIFILSGACCPLSHAAPAELTVTNTGINRINIVLNDNTAGNLLITAPHHVSHLSWKHVGWMCQAPICPATIRVDTNSAGESKHSLKSTFFLDTATGVFTPRYSQETVGGVFYVVNLGSGTIALTAQSVHEEH